MAGGTLRGAPAGGGMLGVLGELAAAASGHLLAGDPRQPIGGVAADTRAVRPGDLFCAIRGERVDAHTLLGQAFAAGAAAVLVDRRPGDCWRLEEVPAGRGAIWVQGAVAALGRLAARHLAGLDPVPPVVGITGSVGKTGTRGLVAAALGGGGAAVLTPEASFNTEVTVPLVCLRADRQRYVVLELAMRGPGQIAHLCRICHPRVAVLTVIGQSHLELLGSQAAIVRAKGELVAALPPDGRAILNADDPFQAEIARRSPAPVLWYGVDHPADVYAEGVRPAADGYRFRAVFPDGVRQEVVLPLVGRHHVRNALAALAAAWTLGVAPPVAAAGLAGIQPEAHRLVWTRAGRVYLLDDAYNAAPQSVLAALATLGEVAADRPRAAVLGDMLELGTATDAAHEDVGRAAAATGLLWLVTVGPLAGGIARAAVAAGMEPGRVVGAQDRAGALARVEELLAASPDGTAVLVKGSRALGLEEVAEAITRWGQVPP